MSPFRSILSLESLGERIVPDAAPITSLPGSLPGPMPSTVTYVPKPGDPNFPPSDEEAVRDAVVQFLRGQLLKMEVRLRDLQLQIAQLDNLYHDALREMGVALANGDWDAAQGWLKTAGIYRVHRGTLIDAYKKLYTEYDTLGQDLPGFQPPPDIASFDPTDRSTFPVIPEFIGGPYT